MLVEFSPWETADTSLRLSLPKRKRSRRGDLSSSCGFFPITGSVVTTKAGKKKKRTNTESARAIFAITSPHRVTVLVEKNKGFSAGAPTTEAADAAFSLHESRELQYTSRPGDSSAFLNEESTKIPVLFDARNDRLFALQDGNRKLVCWESHLEGPDDKNSKGTAKLKEKATSLSLLPNGMLIGSCEDGNIFCIAVESDNSLIVQYLSQSSDQNIEGMLHAGTFVALKDQATGTIQYTGKKRKNDKMDGFRTFELYQIFIMGTDVVMVRHELAVPEAFSSANFSVERKSCRTAIISLLPPGLDDKSSVVEGASLMPVTSSCPETVNLFFRLRGPSESVSKQYCCSIHVIHGNLAHPPYISPCSRQHSTMMNHSVLAMAEEDKLYLCDASNGAVIHSEPLPAFLEQVDDWMLLSDPRKGHLLLLSIREGHLHVTKSTVSMESADGIRLSSKMTLAARVSASLSKSTGKTPLSTAKIPQSLVAVRNKAFSKETLGDDLVSNAVEKAMEELLEFEAMITKKGVGKYKPGHLIDSYDRFTDSIFQALDRKREYTEKEMAKLKIELQGIRKQTGPAENKASSGPVPEQVNGFHESESPRRDDSLSGPVNGIKSHDGLTHLNGTHSDRMLRGTLPLLFVDGAASIIVRLLLHVKSVMQQSGQVSDSIRNDCCLVLHRLLQTGKVSARRHFECDQSIEAYSYFIAVLKCMEGEQKKEERMRSPMNFMNDMLRHCADVSESQMVAMLHYMFCHSRPADVASSFLDSKGLLSNHPNKALSFRYFKYVEELESEDGKSAEVQQRLERVANRLVIAGSASLLEKILAYSRCNQALLCAALREGFSCDCETGLLSRLLADLAFSGPNLTISRSGQAGKSENITISVTRWIQALFDAFGDRLAGLDDNSKDNSKNNLLVLLESVSSARRQTEHLIALEDIINSCMMNTTDEDNARQKRRKIEPEEDALPAYTVERLAI